MAVLQATKLDLKNFSLLVSDALVPPAIRDLLGSPKNRVEGFIAPGHVCAVIGCQEYSELVRWFHVPIAHQHVDRFQKNHGFESAKHATWKCETSTHAP